MFTSLAELTPAIRAIYPPVSLRQANRIAGWAENYQRRSANGNPTEVAIALFKTCYISDGSKWQARQPIAAEAGNRNYGAKKGQQIAGQLYRGQGGKFTSGGGGASGGQAAASPVSSDGMPSTAANTALDAILLGKNVTDQNMLASLRASGFLTDLNKLSSDGKAYIKALRKGDKKEAARIAKQLAAKMAKKNTPKAGKAKAAPKAAKTAKKPGKDQGLADNRSSVALALVNDGAVSQTAIDALWKTADGQPVKAKVAKEMVSAGLAEITPEGKVKLTDKGRQLAQAAKTGDVKAARAAMGVTPPADETAAEETAKIAEAVTKMMGGRTHKAGDFLIVENPDMPTGWHLPVKIAGVPNRQLAGAAWAALFDPKGYRGNPYTGPKKDEARRKLKALYKANGWPMPTNASEAIMSLPISDDQLLAAETAADEETNLAESGYFVPWGCTSFEQLQAAQAAEESAEAMRIISYQYQRLMENIMSNPEVPDKIAALQTLHSEFIERVSRLTPGGGNSEPGLSMDDSGDDMGEAALPAFPEDEPGEGLIYLREVAHPAAMAIDIAEAAAGEGSPLYMTAQIIEPGWGNKLDNNFYPKDVIKRDAPKFVGAKMYETDHRAAEKSTRTWVSTVTDIVGYTETGAPIAKIAIHDPGFAQRARNLKEAGLLNRLECSILAAGKSRAGFEADGRRGKYVEAIDYVASVDWVTAAGAGGRALALAENRTGGDPTMTITNAAETAKPENTPAPAETAPAATPPVVTIAQETAISEATPAATTAANDEAANITPANPPAPPAPMAEDRVRAILAESKLPGPAIDRLARSVYTDESQVHTAIVAERDYLAAAIGSGKPFGMGEAAAPEPATGPDANALAEVAKRRKAANEKYLGRIG